MAATKRMNTFERNMSHRDYSGERSEYEYGSVAHDYNTRPRRRYEEEVEPRRHAYPKQGRRFNLLGAVILCGAFALFAIAMVNYVQLQSELTSKVKTVAGKQIELNNLESENDEHYSRVIGSIDLADIESVARGELGMTYATEGQVIIYTSVNNDYMRKTDSSN